MKISVLIAFVILLFVNILLLCKYLRKHKEKAENEVRFPLSIVSIFSSFMLFLSVFFGYYVSASPFWSVSGGISIASLLTAISVGWFFLAINFSILFDDSGFVYTNSFEKKREFLYSDITSFQTNSDGSFIINCGDFTISVFGGSKESRDFLELIKQNYPEKNSVSVKKGIFRGNLKNPKQQGIAMIILLILGTGLLFAPVFLPSLLAAPDESELFSKELTFSSFEIIKDNTNHLYLYSDNEEYAYSTKSERFISDINRLMEKCDGETVFTVLYKPKIFFHNANVVYGISDESGFIYYSPKNLDRTEDLEELSVMSVCFGAILIGFSVFLFYTARNPEKFSKKLLEFIFGDEISA